MPTNPDHYDLFISYAHDDNDGCITRFLEELQAAHRRFTGKRTDVEGDAGADLTLFFDRHAIRSLDDWQHRIADGLAHSRLFLAFLSPRYFASEWCRREWKTWIDHEIAKHILSQGAAPIYVVEVPRPRREHRRTRRAAHAHRARGRRTRRRALRDRRRRRRR
jgi:hypothetical protein